MASTALKIHDVSSVSNSTLSALRSLNSNNNPSLSLEDSLTFLFLLLKGECGAEDEEYELKTWIA